MTPPNGEVRGKALVPSVLASENKPHAGVSASARDSKGNYIPERALEIIPEVTPILHLFLNGKMKEADDALKAGDPRVETLYYALGRAMLESLKAFMSFENEDLQGATDHAKHSAAIANAHRRHSWRGYVSSGASWIKGMTDVQRHAELCYQESILMKAMLCILYSGDWFAFVKEALNLRNANLAYRNMNEFIRQADAAAGGHDKSIDRHFRSGVLFGDGINSLILSMLPGSIMTVVHLFGYTGDRFESLKTLYSIGGWTSDSPEPTVGPDEEGIRRPTADICLLVFHLLLANYTYKGVDTNMATRIVEWSFKRYPEGVFYLFAEGREKECRGRPDLALGHFQKMMESCQSEFKSLRNISLWELSICHMSLYDMPNGIKYWRELLANANWSKCVYTYALACCLYREGGSQNIAEAKKLFSEVPGLMQRIAGRSIPLEKYAARKARKFETQGHRLLLPQLEMAYHFLCITRAPKHIIVQKMLPDVEAAVETVRTHGDAEGKQSQYEGGLGGFWDDYCLAHFLHAVCLRYIAHQNDDATVDVEVAEASGVPDAEKRAFESLRIVLDNASKIEVDHYVVYYAHYELGLLYARSGDKTQSRHHLETVLSGKSLVRKTEKGKYSMESNLLIRTHAAMEHLGFEV